MTQRERKRSCTRLLAVIAVAVLVTGAVGVAGASSPPTTPHRFYGTVTDENGDTVGGVTVEFVYDGEVVAQATTDSDGYYDVKVSDPDESADSETLQINAKSTSKSDKWQSAASTELGFVVEAESNGGTGGGDDGDDTDGGDDADQPPSDDPPSSGTGGQPATATTSTTEKPTTGTATSTTMEPSTSTMPTTSSTAESGPSTTETSTPTSDGGIPGFGVGVAFVALLVAALLATRQRD